MKDVGEFHLVCGEKLNETLYVEGWRTQSSKISMLANGGDPQIAAAITDFVPSTHNTATFRGDLQAWLR